jgi:subtilisin family serine protease
MIALTLINNTKSYLLNSQRNSMKNVSFNLGFILLYSFALLATVDERGFTKSLDDIQVGEETLKYSGAGVHIAVIEAAFFPHVAINDNIIAGYDAQQDKPLLSFDCSGRSLHGVHVVGTICARPLVGSRFGGLAYGAKIIPIINANNMDNVWKCPEKYLAALQFAIESDAKIISMSQPLFAQESIRPLIKEGVQRGKIFVVAIGNNGYDKMEMPDYNVDNNVIGALASDEEIKPGFVVVGALSKSSGKSDSPKSNGYHFQRWQLERGVGGSDYYSKDFKGNFIWAPGENIVSCGWSKESGSNYRVNSGTSMATPLVTSVIALLIEKYPESCSADIVAMLMSCPPSASEYEKKGAIGEWPILNCAHLFGDPNRDTDATDDNEQQNM